MFMFDWSALMTPQKATPGQLEYTVVNRILSTSLLLSYLNVNILCLLLLYVSISVG